MGETADIDAKLGFQGPGWPLVTMSLTRMLSTHRCSAKCPFVFAFSAKFTHNSKNFATEHSPPPLLRTVQRVRSSVLKRAPVMAIDSLEEQITLQWLRC
jgi:hypothetical protein